VSQSDELAAVVELACQTADRSPKEQRALLATALRLDLNRSAFVVTNHDPVRPYLFQLADETYNPDGKPVKPSKQQTEKLARRVAEWDKNRYGEFFRQRKVQNPTRG
jgi:hypothetical protein